MSKDSLRAVGLGVAGLIIGCLVAGFAAATWSSMNTRWIGAAMILPLMGLVLGHYLAAPPARADRRRLRAVLFAAGLLLGTLGNYLAFVLVSRTWNRDARPPQSLFYDATHPSELPPIVRASNYSESEESWQEYVIVGAIASTLIIWMFTREPSDKRA